MDEEALFNYIEAKNNLVLAQQMLKGAEEVLLTSMEQDQKKSYTVESPTKEFRVTYVQATRYNVNEQGLRKALTAKVYDKYTKKTLDRSALEKAMNTGAVDPLTVSRFLTEVPGAPYLKLSEKELEQ